MGFSFDIYYNPGKTNKVADVLSMREQGVALHAISVVQFTNYDDLANKAQQYPKL